MRWVALLTLTGCAMYAGAVGPFDVHGTPFDAAHGPRVICWPRDDGFSCVVDRDGEAIRNGIVRAPAKLPEVGSVIVVLPPAARAARARAFLRRFGQRVSTHVVRAREPWDDVATARLLHERLAAVARVHGRGERKDPRRHWVDRPVHSLDAAYATLRRIEPAVTLVVPLARGDRFAVRGPDGDAERTGAQVLAHFPPPRLAPRPWDPPALLPRVHIGVPDDAPTGVRDRCTRLGRRLLARAGAGGAVEWTVLDRSFASMTDAAACFDALQGHSFLLAAQPLDEFFAATKLDIGHAGPTGAR